MPNWCYNKVVLETEDKAALSEFIFKTFVQGVYQPRGKTSRTFGMRTTSLDYGHLTPRQAKEAAKAIDKLFDPKSPSTYGSVRVLTLYKLVDGWEGHTKPDGSWVSSLTYDWMVNNTGTKWSPCDAYWCLSKTEVKGRTRYKLVIDYDTAWAPACEAYKTFCKSHPSVKCRIKYNEPGVGFKGSMWITKGVVTRDNCVDC